MATEHVIHAYTGQAGAAVTKGRLGKFSGGSIVQCSASTDRAIGVITSTVAINEAAGLKWGIVNITSGAAIAQGVKFMSDANGKAVLATATNIACGETLEAAAAADQTIRAICYGASAFVA